MGADVYAHTGYAITLAEFPKYLKGLAENGIVPSSTRGPQRRKSGAPASAVRPPTEAKEFAGVLMSLNKLQEDDKAPVRVGIARCLLQTMAVPAGDYGDDVFRVFRTGRSHGSELSCGQWAITFSELWKSLSSQGKEVLGEICGWENEWTELSV